MRKIVVCTVLLFIFLSNAYVEDRYELISYTPHEQEIQYMMNLYERLKSIESNEMDYEILGEIYSVFENQNERYYRTYQRLLFESYLLYTRNKDVRKYILNYIEDNNFEDEFSMTLYRLYNYVEELKDSDEKSKYITKDGLVDEQINLFNMNEVTVLNDKLGLMLFDNDWKVVSINDANENESNLSLIYGGGTNSVAIYIKEICNIDFVEFKKKEIDGEFYKEKYSEYQVYSLPKEGILSKSGADYIFIGVGNDYDKAFPDISNFSSIIFLYSEEYKTGFVLDFFMNMSKNNNSYDIRHSIYNHLFFQSLLSFIN